MNTNGNNMARQAGINGDSSSSQRRTLSIDHHHDSSAQQQHQQQQQQALHVFATTATLHDDGSSNRSRTTTADVHGCKYALSLTPHDVLLGRGSGPNQHEGNVAFRRTVEVCKDQYVATSSRKAKSAIVRNAVASVKTKNGRFLSKLTKRELKMRGLPYKVAYEIASDEVAIEKVKQALRYVCYKKEDTKIDTKANAANKRKAPPRNSLPSSSTNKASASRRGAGDNDDGGGSDGDGDDSSSASSSSSAAPKRTPLHGGTPSGTAVSAARAGPRRQRRRSSTSSMQQSQTSRVPSEVGPIEVIPGASAAMAATSSSAASSSTGVTMMLPQQFLAGRRDSILHAASNAAATTTNSTNNTATSQNLEDAQMLASLGNRDMKMESNDHIATAAKSDATDKTEGGSGQHEDAAPPSAASISAQDAVMLHHITNQPTATSAQRQQQPQPHNLRNVQIPAPSIASFPMPPQQQHQQLQQQPAGAATNIGAAATNPSMLMMMAMMQNHPQNQDFATAAMRLSALATSINQAGSSSMPVLNHHQHHRVLGHGGMNMNAAHPSTLGSLLAAVTQQNSATRTLALQNLHQLGATTASAFAPVAPQQQQLLTSFRAANVGGGSVGGAASMPSALSGNNDATDHAGSSHDGNRSININSNIGNGSLSNHDEEKDDDNDDDEQAPNSSRTTGGRDQQQHADGRRRNGTAADDEEGNEGNSNGVNGGIMHLPPRPMPNTGLGMVQHNSNSNSGAAQMQWLSQLLLQQSSSAAAQQHQQSLAMMPQQQQQQQQQSPAILQQYFRQGQDEEQRRQFLMAVLSLMNRNSGNNNNNDTNADGNST